MDARLEAWAASGAMALTGRPDGAPLGPPERLVPMVLAAGERLRAGTGRLGDEVDVDALALLGERAALAGLTRRGSISCGGGTRMLPTADGTIAVALVRPDDVASIPAWLGIDVATDHRAVGDDGLTGELVADGSVWAAVTEEVRLQPTAALVEQAALLGLAVAARPDPAAAPEVGPPTDERDASGAVRIIDHGPAPARPPGRQITVVDLSALWAGPLCGQLLAQAGAIVAKVESTSRPDSSRRGDPGLFDLLNGSKASVALDLTRPDGRRGLEVLIRAADIVIESSRPRALEQLGIVAAEVLADPHGPTTWISITGYGRTGPDANRIAYGDVAAVAGGLVVDDDDDQPCFCADAVADPLTGLIAAAAAIEAFTSGRRALLDVAMVDVAARAAGPPLAVPPGSNLVAASPRARSAPQPAAAFGAQTDTIFPPAADGSRLGGES